MDKQRKKYLIILSSILFLTLFFFIARASFLRPKNSPSDPNADKGLIFSRLNDPNLIINQIMVQNNVLPKLNLFFTFYIIFNQWFFYFK